MAKTPVAKFLYPFVPDAIHFKVLENGRVITKAIYTVYGVQADGPVMFYALCGAGCRGAKGWGGIGRYQRL
ncbi:MAG: hypothetical protein R2825_05215 [Saprospiraceae bacterium]